jgi:kumamolisin
MAEQLKKRPVRKKSFKPAATSAITSEKTRSTHESKTTKRLSRRKTKQPALRSYAVVGTVAAAEAGGAPAWRVTDLLAAYNWPKNQPGGGVIAVLANTGGWRQTDVDAFVASIGQPSPSIVNVPNDAANNPGSDQTGDVELALDIQLAAASYFYATGQPAQIRVYFDSIYVDCIQAAANDGCDVLSISWGQNESQWTPSQAQSVENAAQAATEQNKIIILAASGDRDSGDGGPGPKNVDVPSSCPHIIACGGTTKTATEEVVWNENPGNEQTGVGTGTGGGFSNLFEPLPTWQIGAPNGPGRMVPDLAAHADPRNGYSLVLDGQSVTLGGTSAVAPLYAGLFASFGRKLGFISDVLWRNPICFNDITVGDNGAFRADRGADACTGLGSPIGAKIAKLFNI